MGHPAPARRRAVCGLAVAAAVAAVLAQVVEGPAGSGYGWGAVLISCVLVAAPLVAIGIIVLTGDPRFAWVAVGLAALMVAVVLLALVGNWSSQSTSDRVLDTVVAVLVLVAAGATAVVEVPLTRR